MRVNLECNHSWESNGWELHVLIRLGLIVHLNLAITICRPLNRLVKGYVEKVELPQESNPHTCQLQCSGTELQLSLVAPLSPPPSILPRILPLDSSCCIAHACIATSLIYTHTYIIFPSLFVRLAVCVRASRSGHLIGRHTHVTTSPRQLLCIIPNPLPVILTKVHGQG